MLYAVENWSDCVDEMRPLWDLHWAEVGDYTDKIPVNIREDEYSKLANAGVLQVVTARDKSGKLWGYVWHAIMPHLHHQQILTALLDLWFVHPDKRKGGAGVKLFLFAEAALKQRGVSKLHAGHTLKLPLENVFEKLGYKLAELHYTKMV